MADGLLDGERDGGLLTDQGFRSAAWARCWAAESGIRQLLAPSQRERATRSRPAVVEAFISAFRNRIETANGTLKGRFHLEAHLARKFWVLLTRVAAKIAASTFAKLWPLDLVPIA